MDSVLKALYLVFYSEFLAFELTDKGVVWMGALVFLVDFLFQMRVTLAQGIETVRNRHRKPPGSPFQQTYVNAE